MESTFALSLNAKRKSVDSFTLALFLHHSSFFIFFTVKIWLQWLCRCKIHTGMMEVDWWEIRKHAYTQGGGLPCTAFTHSGHFIFVSTVMFSDTISTASHLSCCVDPCVCTGHTHMSGWMQRVRERDTNGFSVKLIMDIAFVLFSRLSWPHVTPQHITPYFYSITVPLPVSLHSSPQIILTW